MKLSIRIFKIVSLATVFLIGVFPDSAFRVDAADPTASVYYSIHLASFRNLQNANRQVNSLQTKGKIVFWKKAMVKGKGLFYRVYLGKYADRDRAAAFWKELKKEGAVSYFGVHEFRETVPVAPSPPLVETPPIPTEKRPEKPLVTKKTRFVDNGNGTVTDTQNGLMWVKNGWRLDFFSAVQWNEADLKCKMFRHGGYRDWRLPTIEEWQSLIDTSHQFPALASPNPFVNVIVHMPYWSGTDYYYSQDAVTTKRPSFESYTVMLYAGTIHHQRKADLAFVMPVRSID